MIRLTDMKDFREYKHENGYVARLYGEDSINVYFNGIEVMHTGYRNVHTEDEVMDLLSRMPEFFDGIYYRS